MLRTVTLLFIAIYHLHLSESSNYKILLDAGSTGTRVHVYNYAQHENMSSSITEIAQRRLHPALTAYLNDSDGLRRQISALMQFAALHVPLSDRSKSPITLMATAGLRELPIEDQNILINNVHKVLRDSQFAFSASETRVISGTDEALFGLFGAWPVRSLANSTFGVIDLGGNSEQVAFFHATARNSSSSIFDRKCYPDFQTANSSATDKVINEYIFARSFRRLGLIAVMEDFLEYFSRYTTAAVTVHDDGTVSSTTRYDDNPCLSRVPPGAVHASGVNEFHGLGDFNICHAAVMRFILPKIEDTLPIDCIRKTRPPMIVGLDNIPKVLEILGIPSNSFVAPRDIADAGRRVCSISWNELLADFPDFMPYRAQRACFAASYIYTMLVDVLGVHSDDATVLLPLSILDSKEINWALGTSYLALSGLTLTQYIP